ncbi:protein kinase domain-containing protein [Tundrisphaera lichenicola]|uniref:protein kinase domain-containing protein n=1 Tax=Tundrisphaera lichenicola TaxID=2029860 RepID=UPI003EB90DFB
MPAIDTTEALIEVIRKSELLIESQLAAFLDRKRDEGSFPGEPYKLAQQFVFEGLLTKYQAEQLLAGRYRNFVLAGKYKLLEQLGRGGMATVFLCEHQVMKRLVAVKILPKVHADDRELLGRFHREARALSQLSHPNIVAAYDVDHANNIHFLVMEYVDGGDLDFIVQKAGPMGFERAAHYIRQAANGLQHAHECGLVHRDMKPGNLLVDRAGTVKLLDLGLARIFHESTDDLTTGRDARMLLGTVDYLAPEQALNSHEVDIRADIYGLGATFYFLLSGKGLFEGGTIAQKLTWHLQKPPSSIAEIRPDVPSGLVHVIEKMLAKKAADRYQTPQEVVEVLTPWTSSPIPPPRSSELPRLSLAARGTGQQSSAPRIPPLSVRTLVAPLSQHKTADQVPTVSEAQIPSPRPISEHRTPVPESVSAKPAPIPVEPGIVELPPRRTGKERLTRRIPAIACGLFLLAAAAFWPFGWIGLGDSSEVPGRSNPSFESGATDTVRDDLIVAGPGRSPDASFSIASPDRPGRKFSTLSEAIRVARSGDSILVRGRLMTEAIEISDVEGTPPNLTIQAEDSPNSSTPIVWRAPRDLAKGRALLDVAGLEGFHLRGFVLDGEGRLPELIRLSGRAGGSVLEDLELSGATRADLVVRGWSGESSRPAVLRNVRFETKHEIDAAIDFDTDPDRPNLTSDSIRIDSCRFVGPFHSAILIAGCLTGLELRGSRFQGATDGLRYRKDEDREPIRAQLSNNVFSDLRRGIHFETTPPASSSDLLLLNNLFVNTPRLASLDKVSVQPSTIFGRWIWAESGRDDHVAPPGDRYFRKVFDLGEIPEKARLDISCDESFTVWLNGSEVGGDPSSHYSQRVFSFKIADWLQRGQNVLAVKGNNNPDRLDENLETAAGLLAQITDGSGGKNMALVQTDETWKWADQASEGWNQLKFDDQAWKSVRLMVDLRWIWPWTYAVWDSTVQSQLLPPLEPIQLKASGNVRDQESWEGYPILGAERLFLRENTLPKDPDDDSTFLRLSRSHPLGHSGPANSSVGILREE